MFRHGDRVRIVRADSEYTGCRGTIADPDRKDLAGVSVLGHEVAIDGENGVSRPFLVEDLVPLRAVSAGSSSTVGRSSPQNAKQEREGGSRSD